MRVKMAAVISLDSKIKNDDTVHRREWISEEDKVYFSQLMDAYELIVMGRKTYKSMALKPTNGKRYIVVTRNPALYASEAKEGLIEFTSDSPWQIVDKFSELGFTELLLVGGNGLYTLFLDASLVDQLDLTIEPVILGQGKCLVDSLGGPTRLRLIEQSQLNQRGTLLLKLEVVKDGGKG